MLLCWFYHLLCVLHQGQRPAAEVGIRGIGHSDPLFGAGPQEPPGWIFDRGVILKDVVCCETPALVIHEAVPDHSRARMEGCRLPGTGAKDGRVAALWH